MINKIIAIIVLANLSLVAAYNPLVKAKSGTKIIDIGYQVQKGETASYYAPKVWAATQGTFLPFEVIDAQARLTSPNAKCVTDSFGSEDCPLLSESCPSLLRYSSGQSSKKSKTLTVNKSCTNGMTYNTITNTCTPVGYNVCQKYSGTSYDPATDKCSKPNATAYVIPAGAVNYANYPWPGILGKYGIVQGTYSFLFYAPVSGVYTATMMADDYGTVQIDNSAIKNNRGSYPNVVTLAVTLSQGEHTIKFSGRDLYGGPSAASATITDTSGNLMWNSRTGQSLCSSPYIQAGANCVIEPECPTYAPSLSKGVCYGSSTCDSGFSPVSNDVSKCYQNYSYYAYSCPTTINNYGNGYLGPITSGADCLGACPNGRIQDCVCNSPTPPAQNCSQQDFTCPIDAAKKCTNSSGETSTKKPMQTHESIGFALTENVFNQYSALSCGTNCIFGINKIYTDKGKLCVSKPLGESTCSEVKGCTFEGKIEVGAGEIISALWTDASSSSISGSSNIGSLLQGKITSTCKLNGAVGFQGRVGPIVGMKTRGERMLFWSQYQSEGYLGFIEATREVASLDAQDGYIPSVDTAWKLRNAGFNRIEVAGSTTYAISEKTMTNTECSSIAAKYAYYYTSPILNGTINGGVNIYELVNNATGGNYNNSTNITTYKVSARCESQGATYDPAQDLCLLPANITQHYSDTRCSDHQSNIYYTQSGQTLTPRWYTGTWNCGGTSDYVQNPIITIPTGGVVTNVAYKTHVWAGGCYDWTLTGTLIQNKYSQNVTVCPADGAQRPHMELDLNVSYIQKTSPICPADSLSRQGFECTVPVSPYHRCVLTREDGVKNDFIASEYAIKKVISTNQQKYFCSPLVCTRDHFCRYNECPAGTDPTLVPQNAKEPDPYDCVSQLCDENLQYYHWCGKVMPCPINEPGFVMKGDACMHLECTKGNYDSKTGKCLEWRCPDGYAEVGGQCAKKQ